MHIKKFAFRVFTVGVTPFFLSFSQSSAQQRLVIIGGGARPAAALARFDEWAGKEKAHILIISWATQSPDVAFKNLQEDLAPYPKAVIEAAPAAPLTEATKIKFLDQLKNATGVFFSGGDQGRIMDVLNDQAMPRALTNRHPQRVAIGRTSARTAIISPRMTT